MIKKHNVLGFCLTLALVMAGFSGAQAATIVIDDFQTGDQQQAPPPNTVDAPSAIGGKRTLLGSGEVTGFVSDGLLNVLNSTQPGGTFQAVWDGGGSLGGIDLTDGGTNAFFDVRVVLKAPDPLDVETLGVRVEDSNGVAGTVSLGWQDLSLGSNLIPFSSLSNGVDLTSVDLIGLDFSIAVEGNNISIGSVSAVVPVPAAAWLFGSGLLGLVGVARRCKARA